MSSLLEVRNVSCQYEKTRVVEAVSFDLSEGTLACLLGPSGCGKTTILRAIAGFHPLISGEIYLDGELISSRSYVLKPELRQLGMVFQDHALFPHLSVFDNVAAGLQVFHGKAKKALVHSMLERVRLNGKEHRFPHELSGGQQQRIALARALAPRPRLLLMDEPFSNLDVELRDTLGVEVRDLLRDSVTTCLLVTHDQQDAFTFSDTVGVMNEGRMEQWDSAYNLYHEPVSRFVADFIGQGAFLKGRVLEGGIVETELAMLHGKVPPGCEPGCPVKVLVRPDDVVHNDASALSARIVSRNFRGSSYLYTLELDSGTQILSMVHSHHNHALGGQLGIELELEHLVVFPDESARAEQTRQRPQQT